MLVHSLFDLLALLAALAAYRLVPAGSPEPWLHPLYLPAAAFGAVAGAYAIGSANLWLSGIHGVARSIEGAIAGAIVAVEVLKRQAGMRGSTGLRLVAPLAAAIAVGRIGCFFAGLDDMTYGTPTTLWWGIDFGDGTPRHPVQLYEAAVMAASWVCSCCCCARDTRPRCARGSTCLSGSTRSSGSPGSSSSPMAPLSAR